MGKEVSEGELDLKRLADDELVNTCEHFWTQAALFHFQNEGDAYDEAFSKAKRCSKEILRRIGWYDEGIQHVDT